ncbi:MAG: AAA family ATPase [Rickettsiales bacterium]|nr:AAA family ATPase [Rickettsiales bacterium]
MQKEPVLRPKKTPQFVAFIKDPSSTDAAQSVASNHGWSESCVHYGDVRQAIVYLKEQVAPKTLLIEIPSAKDAPELLDRLADVCTPSMRIIIAGDIDEFSFYSWLKSIGIEHYLLQPFDAKKLDETISMRAEGEEEQKDTEAKVIAVIGARGGVGTTTIATNLAYLLAETYHHKTAFLDIDPYFGTAATAYDITPNHGLRDALDKPDRIDNLFLERVMIQHTDNLSVLSAEESFTEMVSSSASAAEALIGGLAENFAYTVVDLPCSLTSLTRSVLAQADHIVIVGELSLLSLRDILRLRDYFKSGLSQSEPLIVINRKGLAGEHELTIKEFEKNYGQTINTLLPFTREAFSATSSGEMLVDVSKNTKLVGAMHALAEQFTDSEINDKPVHKVNLLDKLLGRE